MQNQNHAGAFKWTSLLAFTLPINAGLDVTIHLKAVIIAFAVAVAGLLTISVSAPVMAAPNVLFKTSMGDIEIELHPEVAPGHVQNFLNYVNDGDYDSSFVHRSVSDFVIQGGAFTYINPFFYFVPTDPPIPNEFALSNVRGTVAMAKADGDPNSATSQWFINLVDNSANLDSLNGGFTVFGTVVQGMDVADAINDLPIADLGSPFGNQVPVRNTPPGDPIVWESHLVFIESATQSTHYQIPVLPQVFIWALALILGLVARVGFYSNNQRTPSKS